MHQVLFRTAWIFKTESVIMPAFLDTISGAGWVRGLLPPLNRFGQSLAPLLLSDRLTRASVKSRWLSHTTMLMGLPFLSIGALLLLPGGSASLLVAFFLISYFVFFCVTGVNQATFNTIQGKLIRAHRRGRLMAIAGYIGSPVAVLMAWLLLKPWTEAQPPKYALIFLFTGVVFVLAGLTVRRLKEVPDPVEARRAIDVRRRFGDAWKALQNDPHLRQLCLLAALFVCTQLLFPHYQRLGQQRGGFEGQMLMYWVIAQNLSAAAFSWISGRLADVYGTRSALRWLTFAAIFAPLLALVLDRYAAAGWYWLTFVLLGAVPVTYRMFLNYALELTNREQHPIYVSTVVLSMAPPIVFSPLVGEVVDRTGYVLPFVAISAMLCAAWGLTLRLVEPRQLNLKHTH
ncbi:MAG: MFS transporter [Fuerstiella sp.]